MRAGLGAVAAALIVGSCTSTVRPPIPAASGVPSEAATHGSSADGQSPTHQPSAEARLLPAVGTATLRCDNVIDGATPPATWQTVLGVVGLATSPQAPAVQTAVTGDREPSRRLFAKIGLIVRAGARFTLTVLAGSPGGLGIGWGNSARPHRDVVVAGCPDVEHTGWLSYPGGYWINHPACVVLVVRAGGRTQRVHVGLGVACPGQRPPQGSSDR